MAVKLFQGKDRRMLTKCMQLFTAILARDARVDNPKPTSLLSNRTKMLQEAGSAENQAVATLQTRFQTLLDSTK